MVGVETARSLQWLKLSAQANGLSYADITRAIENAFKHAIVEKRPVGQCDIVDALAERKLALKQTRPARKSR